METISRVEQRPYLYSVIKRYCEDKSTSNGLFLVDMPTGSGKTHTVMDYIYEAAMSEQFANRKIFFITTLKKNLQESELQKRFARAGNSRLFEEKFLFLDANAECVMRNLTEDVIAQIPEKIRKADEYKQLEQKILYMRRANNNALSNSDMNSDEIRCIYEPKFRRFVEKQLAKQFKRVKDRIEAVKTDPEWRWIARIYPAVCMENRQIIFMSMDKLLSGISTIVEPSFLAYQSKIMDNALVFIDEFDATKETVLKHIIEDGMRNRIDHLDLFLEIYAALQTNQFPDKLTAPSRAHRLGSGRSLEDKIHHLTKRAKTITDNECSFLTTNTLKTRVNDLTAKLVRMGLYHTHTKDYLRSIAKAARVLKHHGSFFHDSADLFSDKTGYIFSANSI